MKKAAQASSINVPFVWMLNEVGMRILPAAILISLFIIMSLPIPWMHWQRSQNLTTREQTFIMQVSVEEGFPNAPRFVRSYLGFYDRMQFNLMFPRAK